MDWNLEEAMEYYQRQGAPRDQNALVNLLKEVQQHCGSIHSSSLAAIAQCYRVKESYLQAVIRRIPSLRLDNRHILEVCAGPNCGKHTALAIAAEALGSTTLTVKFVPCMRQCGKGPNIRFDGTLYHRADETLLDRLISDNNA